MTRNTLTDSACRSGVTLAFACWGGLGQITGCTVIVNADTAQCKTNADCHAKGPAFAETVCTASDICAQKSCTDSSQCKGSFGPLGYCRASDSICTRVPNEPGFELMPEGALDEGQAIVLGFMTILSGANINCGSPLKEGAQLALQEIEERGQGCPV
ncbi:hypothetical protein ACFL5O_11050 [Myxococcota bacterium]